MNRSIVVTITVAFFTSLACSVAQRAWNGTGPLAYFDSAGGSKPANGALWNGADQTLDLTVNGNSAGSFYNGYQVTTYGGFGPGFVARLARGTQISPSMPLVGDPLLIITAKGYTPGGWAQAAGITVDAAQNWSPTAMGGLMDLFVGWSGSPGGGGTAIHIDSLAQQLQVSLGTNANQYNIDPAATVHIKNAGNGRFNGSPAGPTKLVVQQGASQGAVPLQEWQDLNGAPLARINADGSMEFFVAGVWRKVALQ